MNTMQHSGISTPLDITSEPDSSDRTALRVFAWSGPLAVVLALFGMVIIGGYVPATDPSAGPREIADFYVNHLTRVRIGMLLSMTAFSLFVPFGIVIALQTRRIERTPLMTYIQIATTAMASLEGVVSTVIWLTAAYRPDTSSPEITRMLHDMGWICFLVTIPPFSVWIGSIGIAILRDKHPTPLFARWVGYLNLWVSLLIFPAMMLPFFKTGPFAYNGLFALYLPFVTFFAWMCVMSVTVQRAINTNR